MYIWVNTWTWNRLLLYVYPVDIYSSTAAVDTFQKEYHSVNQCVVMCVIHKISEIKRWKGCRRAIVFSLTVDYTPTIAWIIFTSLDFHHFLIFFFLFIVILLLLLLRWWRWWFIHAFKFNESEMFRKFCGCWNKFYYSFIVVMLLKYIWCILVGMPNVFAFGGLMSICRWKQYTI